MRAGRRAGCLKAGSLSQMRSGVKPFAQSLGGDDHVPADLASSGEAAASMIAWGRNELCEKTRPLCAARARYPVRHAQQSYSPFAGAHRVQREKGVFACSCIFGLITQTRLSRRAIFVPLCVPSGARHLQGYQPTAFLIADLGCGDRFDPAPVNRIADRHLFVTPGGEADQRIAFGRRAVDANQIDL